MSENTYLASVSVEGLHRQFDVTLNLNPQLNIIYGKNGRGKTTILHIIANASELDFDRFKYLEFKNIILQNNIGDTLEISKNRESPFPQVRFNGSQTNFSKEEPRLSEAEAVAIRNAFGGRATYLPAFRAILEGTRRSGFRTDHVDVEDEQITQAEVEAMREAFSSGRSEAAVWRWNIREIASNVARKTSLCRQWFGPFVPVIRYPSVQEVEAGLTDEWENAQLEINRREQRMFEETFLRIFKSIAGDEVVPASDENDVLAEIEGLLSDKQEGTSHTSSSGVYSQLGQVLKKLKSNDSNKSLLEIYRQALEARSQQRLEILSKTRKFGEAVNRFLDNKRITLGTKPDPKRRRAISVSSQGRTYGVNGLSSGERQIVTMLYSASRTQVASGIFLIDEPELSLHVDWQRIVLQEIKNQAPDRQIIACTHSPEVGADHLSVTQDFEPRAEFLAEPEFGEEDE